MPLNASGAGLPFGRALRDAWLLGALALASGPLLTAEPVVVAVTLVAAGALLVARPVAARQLVSRSQLTPGDSAAPARWDPHPAHQVVGSALLLAAVAAVRTSTSLAQAELRYEQARQLLTSTEQCEARAVVVGSPVRRRAPAWQRHDRAFERRLVEQRTSETVVLELRAGECDDRTIRVPLRARLYDAPAGLGRGDEVELAARLSPLELARNPGLSDPLARVALSGIVASGQTRSMVVLERGRGVARAIDAARAFVRGRIEQSYAPEHAPFARALVLGETDLDDADRIAFQRSGLAHLLAVSGTHLVVTVLALVAALRALLARVPALAARHDGGALASGVGVLLAVAYADFAGGSGSAARAAAMLSAALLARASGRQPSTRRCFALSLGAAALCEPLVLCDPSFSLSIGATAGLLVGRRAVTGALRSGGCIGRGLASAVGCTLGATAGCTPVLLTWGADLPLLGVAANLLAAPFAEAIALPCCLAHAALWWLPSAEQGAAVVASGALGLARLIAHAASAPSFATVALPRPTAEQLGALLVAAVSAARIVSAASVERAIVHQAMRSALLVVASLAVACIGLLELEAERSGQPRGLLRVTVLDVGQGDALLVDLPNGRSMIVDMAHGPPGDTAQRVLEPMLRARRRARIDWLVVTHAHADHAGGLAGLLARHAAPEIWLPDLGRAALPEGDPVAGGTGGDARGYEWLERGLERSGVTVRTARELCEHPWWLGAVRVDVLSPCAEGGNRPGDSNHRSLVLRLGYGLRSVLLAADADASAERAIVDASEMLGPVDLLKVGHHGARTATSDALVAAFSPRLAAISCGARNRLGHPDPAVLERLAASGAVVWRTDRDGALEWQTDGLRVEVAGPRAWSGD